MNTTLDDYQRIEQAILYLKEHAHEQPGLEEIARHLGLSEYHFQRLFTRWAGVSPKRFLQFLTKENAKRLLESSANLLDTTYEAGLSSPGRLHDLFVTCEAVTPGEYKHKGAGLSISYGFHASPFGECLLALTGRGVCHLSFVEDGQREAARRELQEMWLNADLREDPARSAPLAERIFGAVAGQPPLAIHLRGTNFQLKVWEALLRVPPGGAITYAGLAASLGQPGAARAVGNAVGRNPVAFLIPCHRVLRKVGEFGGYRYGPARKQAILGWELARLANASG